MSVMIGGVGPVNAARQAVRLYDTQKVYGERLKTYASAQPVVQGQADAVSISRAASTSFVLHRAVAEEALPLAYGNPRVDNNRKR